MATYKSDLATSQEAALLDSSKLANDGTTHTGVLKVSTARVTIPGGIASTSGSPTGHTLQGLLLPPGARVIPNLCDVIVNDESGMDYTASIQFRSDSATIMATIFSSSTRYPNIPKVVSAAAIAPSTQSQWVDVDFAEQNGTSQDLIIDIYVAYVGI